MPWVAISYVVTSPLQISRRLVRGKWSLIQKQWNTILSRIQVYQCFISVEKPGCKVFNFATGSLHPPVFELPSEDACLLRMYSAFNYVMHFIDRKHWKNTSFFVFSKDFLHGKLCASQASHIRPFKLFSLSPQSATMTRLVQGLFFNL